LCWVDPGWTPGAHQDGLSFPSSAEQGRENITKCSWVEIRTGRSLTCYLHGQNRLDMGKLI